MRGRTRALLGRETEARGGAGGDKDRGGDKGSLHSHCPLEPPALHGGFTAHFGGFPGFWGEILHGKGCPALGGI